MKTKGLFFMGFLYSIALSVVLQAQNIVLVDTKNAPNSYKEANDRHSASKQQIKKKTKTKRNTSIKLKDSNCTTSFSIPSQKVILPVKYYHDYIKQQTVMLPHYVEFEFDSGNSDTGYVYCMGVKKGGQFICINHLDKMIKSGCVNFVKVNGKSKTYFLFNQKNTKIKFNLPLIKRFYQLKTSSIILSLLQHQENKNKEACLAEDKSLKLSLEPFKIGYKVSQTLIQDEKRVKNCTSNVTISNPQKVKIKLYDLYSKRNITTTKDSAKLNLNIYNNKLAGFCVKFDMDFLSLHLQEGYDYFCKTTTFGDFNFAVFDDALKNANKKPELNTYIQVGAIRLVDARKNELPFEMLGLDKASKLIKEGYKNMQTSYIGDMIYILVGPFDDKLAKKELSKIKHIIDDALIYDEALIKCKNRPNGCKK